MKDDTGRSPGETHEVLNQPPLLEGVNLVDGDAPLQEAVRREGAGWAAGKLVRFGQTLAGEPLDWGDRANRNRPELRTHDRQGRRIDEVDFHPAYHELMRLGVEHGLHTGPWRDPQEGAHVARAAFFYAFTRVDAGTQCPMSMTYSAVPALRHQPEVAREWEPRLRSLVYDPRMRPPEEKSGALCGMAMTEKQGGSDVRANTTEAQPLGAGGPGGEHLLTGHKWFCSAPMSDVFLTLAHTEGGLSCFLLPRWLPDGTRNRIRVQRLKDKLGDRSNASSEVEFREAWARMVGPEGRGVPTIIEMVNHTRLDCTTGAAGLMRYALAEAAHHAAHRQTFGKRLVEHPLMRNVLADLAVEHEAATALAMRLARSYDEADREGAGGEHARRFARLATAIGKYWTCKRLPVVVGEALECLGGNGYVEECLLPRYYRQAPLNSIWEGSGNVMCLDVLRALTKNPESLDAYLEEVDAAAGGDRRLDAAVREVREALADTEEAQYRARRVVERMALTLQGALLVRYAPPAVADAFCASRLAGDQGLALGTLPRGIDPDPLLERTGVASG